MMNPKLRPIKTAGKSSRNWRGWSSGLAKADGDPDDRKQVPVLRQGELAELQLRATRTRTGERHSRNVHGSHLARAWKFEVQSR
jgi:hypothetical protein